MRFSLRLVAIGIVGAATIAALHFAVYLPVVCEVRASSAELLLSRAAKGGEGDRQSAADLTLDSLQACQCLERESFRFPHAMGTAYLYRHEPKAAIDAFERALLVDRRPETYMGLGMALLDANDRARAIESFVRAGSFDPARLAEIPYVDIRAETARRIRVTYGSDWIR